MFSIVIPKLRTWNLKKFYIYKLNVILFNFIS